jgi:wyosine [tRNA(Phe)-imidazoG37] synthetase (radical SAM superfamily)
LGKTTEKTRLRQEYVATGLVLEELCEKLTWKEKIDFITLAGSGEPTLNSGIGNLIHEIKKMTNIPVAVLTNGSLLWIPDVQDTLMEADVVLPSLDAGDAMLFEYVNRPCEDLVFEQVIDGIADFTKSFPGEVWLEVLLLAGVTGVQAEVNKIAELAKRIGPARTHLNTVCRPPSEDFAFVLTGDQLSPLRNSFGGRVEVIMEEYAREVAVDRAAKTRVGDILALLSRRPCTSSEVASGLGIHATEVMKYMEHLTDTGKLRRMPSAGRYFYALSHPGKVDGKGKT